MILTINGQQVALKKDASIEYVSENRIFTNADDYSMEIELPLAGCSQKLLASPVARPHIDALHYAQRTNTIGSLRGSDVSRSITAPTVLAQTQPQVIIQENAELRETIKQLKERLDEPFVTVNSVIGDYGIKQVQDNYQRLMNKKSPKNKRK